MNISSCTHPCAFATRFRWITFCTYKHLVLSPGYDYRWWWHSLMLIKYYTYRNNSLLLILHNTTTNAHIFTNFFIQITKCCVCRVRSMWEGFDTQLCCWQFISDNTSVITSRWRHDGRDSVSNHQPRLWLLKCLYRSRSKKITPRYWPLCREFTGGRWIPRTKGSAKRSPFNDVTMISRSFLLAIFKIYT